MEILQVMRTMGGWWRAPFASGFTRWSTGKNRKQETGGWDMNIDIGISEQDRTEMANGLGRLLADTYTLYLKTHNFHWNVTGPMFQTLHLMFETQYNELALAVDLIAERIRALGLPAPGTYGEFTRLSSIEETGGVPRAEDMIRLLVEGQEAVVRTARSIFPAAEKASDEATADLLTQRIQLHEKSAWMLRSLLEK
jgi:starvation-inducible DNA-binding protein